MLLDDEWVLLSFSEYSESLRLFISKLFVIENSVIVQYVYLWNDYQSLRVELITQFFDI